MANQYPNPYITKRTNGFVLKLSKSLDGIKVRIVSESSDVEHNIHALMYEDRCDERDISVLTITDEKSVKGYAVINTRGLDGSHIDVEFENPNIVYIYNKLTKDEEDFVTDTNRYKMMHELASEYLHLPGERRNEADMTYCTFTDSDRAVINYDPNSEWFIRQSRSLRDILCKCAYEELTSHKELIFPYVMVQGEYNDDFTPTHKHYCIAIDSPAVMIKGFNRIDIKDYASWRKKMDLPYIQNNLYVATDLDADNVRTFTFMKDKTPHAFYIVRTMDWIRSSSYRKDCFDAAEIHNGCARCAYCGLKFNRRNMEADHIIPVYAVTGKKGGAYKAYMESHGFKKGINDPKNLTPACRTCNRMKGKKTGAWILLGFIGKTRWFHPLMKALFYTIITACFVKFISTINEYSVFEGISKWSLIKREFAHNPNYLYVRIATGVLIARLLFVLERKIRNS